MHNSIIITRLEYKKTIYILYTYILNYNIEQKEIMNNMNEFHESLYLSISDDKFDTIVKQLRDIIVITNYFSLLSHVQYHL